MTLRLLQNLRCRFKLSLLWLQLAHEDSDSNTALRKISKFHLFFWFWNFVETRQKPCVATNFRHQEIRWNYSIWYNCRKWYGIGIHMIWYDMVWYSIHMIWYAIHIYACVYRCVNCVDCHFNSKINSILNNISCSNIWASWRV